ncbi:MAG: hypothetical protein JO100_00145 [Pseudonocardia sp.]|nr:hypothetical protein [Pseudonocardia sp.]
MTECRCFLPTKPPATGEWWRPDLDDDPGKHVQAVVRYGESPELRRAVRRSDDTGWDERGAMVEFVDITPPMRWERIGRCWDNTPHPVVAVRQEADGTWSILDG